MNKHKLVRLAPLQHRGNKCIAMYYNIDQIIDNAVRRFPGRTFSITHSCWYVIDGPGLLDRVIDHLSRENIDVDVSAYKNVNTHGVDKAPEHVDKTHARQPLPPLSEEHMGAIRLSEQRLNLKGYSVNTKKTYKHQLKEFFAFYNDTSALDITENEINNYMVYLVEKKKVSRSTHGQAINAIKFFYERVLKQERKVYHLERPMREKRLPEVLSTNEVLSIFAQLSNLKHKLMMMLLYSGGLRRSELLNLRAGDVDIERRVIFIRGGKGKKDRQTILADRVIPLFEEYVKKYDPLLWLFQGSDGGQYSVTSLRKILERAVKGAGIRKRVRLHMLRHSFATHLLEAGTSTRYIQVLLGHESPKTTEQYTHVAAAGIYRVRSPLDNIEAGSDRKRLEDEGGAKV